MSASSWVRPVVLGASCLVLGFVGGWSAASVGGDEVSLPEANVDVTVEKAAPKTTDVADPVEKPPARSSITVAVLNGTTTTGRASQTATQLKELGYTKVVTGNISTQAAPTTVYFREGAKASADQLAKDLQLQTVRSLEGTPIAADSEVGGAALVLVLGTG